MRCVGLAAVAVLCLAGPAVAQPALDQPLRTQHVSLGPSQYTPGEQSEVRCFTYPGFMLKEIDEREVGAEQISIVPLGRGTEARCEKSAATGELVISADQWSGYVVGAKDGYVFLRSADGANGGIDVGVYRAADATKLFQDTIRDAREPAIRTVTIAASTLRLRYERVVTGRCSILHDHACWARMAAELHLPASQAPDCRTGYQRARSELAAGRCEAQSHPGDAACVQAELRKLSGWDTTPSVIGYGVEAVVTPSGSAIQPTGGTVACWPAD